MPERGGRSHLRRADGKIDENDAVAVRFDDPSEIGKGEKYRGGIIVRVNADRQQRGKRGICGKDNGAALIVEDSERGNTALRELQVCIEPFGGGKTGALRNQALPRAI